MATSSSDSSPTILRGSDAMYDYFCEICHTDNLHVEAVSYCNPCAVHLCAGCLRDHKRNPASRLHQLLDADNMPEMETSQRSNDVLTEPCPSHPEKLLEYYCETDGSLCCQVCLTIDHALCATRAYIPAVSDGAANGQEYKDLATSAEHLVLMATDEEIIISIKEEDNDAYRTSAIADIQSNRKEMDKQLDVAEKRAIDRVNELHKENAEQINSASQSCKSVMPDANAMAADLEEKAKAGQNNKLFVGMKLAARRLSAMKQEINQLQTAHYWYDKDKSLQEFNSTLGALFSVTVRQEGANITARHAYDVDIKAEDDDKDCIVNGIAALPGDRLVVTDCGNNVVKLVNVNLNKMTSRLALSSAPLDIAKTQPEQVAVSLGNEKKIDIFTAAADSLFRIKSIDVGRSTFSGICHDGSGFIVVSSIARSVRIVDIKGKIVSTVYKDSDEDPHFKAPRYITLGRSRDVVYISDPETQTVTCMTLRGRIIWVYKHTDLTAPQGVAVGRDGNVIICGKRSHCVQLLSRSGQLVQVLLDRERGLAPFSLSMCVHGDKIWVGNTCANPKFCSFVKAFQLE